MAGKAKPAAQAGQARFAGSLLATIPRNAGIPQGEISD
jgi:hypothetical protein